MTSKEDLRIIKTKSALNRAFVSLLTKRAFEDISVNELCDEAGVRRATFYKHYKDKYDFFSAYIGSLRIQYDEDPDTPSHLDATVDYYVNYAKKVVEYLDENSVTVDHLLTSDRLHVIVGIITEKNYRDTEKRLSASESAGMRLPASSETVSSMLIGGVSTVITQWLLTGKNRPAEQITAEISVLVRNILTV